jgi:hypothetical protein
MILMILMISLSNLLELEEFACGLRKPDWYNLKQMQQEMNRAL